MAPSENQNTRSAVELPTQTRLAKLTRPRLSNTVARPRLFAELDAAGAVSLTWVQGPPGAGKTSLVTSYLQGRGLAGIWYQVDREDADLASFFYYLRLATPHGGDALPLLTPEHLRDIDGFSRRFFREWFARLMNPGVVVFDNHQEVPEDATFHRVVALAALEAPPGLRILVLSHDEPSGAYVRLRANQQLLLLGWEQTRLTLEETATIVLQRRPGFDAERIGQLHQQSDGWAAGLVLLMEQWSRGRSSGQTERDRTPGSIFDYFAAEVFRELPEATRGLLLRTAMLPGLTADMAVNLTSDAQAGDRLETLYQRQLFVDRREDGHRWYQYHGLFREFLLQRAHVELPSEDWQRLLVLGASLLVGHDRRDDALPLLVEAHAWEQAVKLILTRAQALLDQGRWQTLQQWIDALPEPVRGVTPWIGFWRGMCALRIHPPGARLALERAFADFKHNRDPLGQALAATAILEAHMVEWVDYARLDPWIADLESLLSEPSVHFPSPNVELAVRASLFTAIIHRQTARDDIPRLAHRLAAMLRHDLDPNATLLAARGLFVYGAYSGDAPLVDQVMAATQSAYRAPSASALNRAWYAARLGFALRYSPNARTEARKWFASARLIIRNEGLGFVEAPIAIYSGWAEEAYGDNDDVEREFQLSADCYNPSSRFESAFRHMAQALLMARRQDSERALDHMTQTLTHMTESGFTLGQLAAYMGLTASRLISADFAAAKTLLDRQLAFWFPCPLRAYVDLTTHALIALGRNNHADAQRLLRQGFDLGTEHRLEAHLSEHFLRGPTARLAAYALERDIHADYARKLIKAQNLAAPSADIDRWPWRVRIQLFGQFSLGIDDQPLGFTGKAPKKPLEILKCLAAAGEPGLNSLRLAEQLWPDSDDPRGVLNVNLSRLRQLIPIKDAFLMDEQQLRFNPQWVWCDVAAFERLVEQITRQSRAPDLAAEDRRALADRLFSLYRGELLPGEFDPPMLLPARDRAHRKFVRAVKTLTGDWVNQNNWREAAELCERAVEIDHLAEDFHRGLMQWYLKLGRAADALRAFRRGEQALSAAAGPASSASLRALAKQLGLVSSA